MGYMERPRRQTRQFVPTATFESIFTPPLFIFQESFAKEIPRVQQKNAQWAQDTLNRLREESQKPFLDILIVDENGEIIDTISSYRSYADNKDLPLTVSDLAARSQRERKLVFPLTAENDSVLFWGAEDDFQVQAVIHESFKDLQVEEYPADMEISDSIHMCRIRRNVLGTGNFARNGIILGSVGFWRNYQHKLTDLAPYMYIQRVSFQKSMLMPNPGYASPLDPDAVRMWGGTPKDLYFRLDPKSAKIDFIATALSTISPVLSTISPVVNSPVVLRFNTIRPWLDESPRPDGVRIN